MGWQDKHQTPEVAVVAAAAAVVVATQADTALSAKWKEGWWGSYFGIGTSQTGKERESD